ncbi:hypothetical protein ABPG72_013536 [Tetrahymena utriculariae]
MSFKAQLEVLVHMESFRNINIYHQGIYVMRARIFQRLEDGTTINAHPYRIVDFDSSLIREKMKQKYKLNSDLYDCYFFSKAFIIKYMDEMVDLDDICHFRAEIDSYPHYNEDNFFFTVDLMFADLSSQTSENVSLNDPDKAGFKVVGTFESLLHNSFKGIREYVPIYFGDLYYSQVNLTVHTALINYQFRYLPPKITENEKQKKHNNNQVYNPENFDSFFNLITDNFRPSQVDEIYNTYVGSLRFDHKKFLKHFKELAQKMIKNEFKLQEIYLKIQEPAIPEYLQLYWQSQNQPNNQAMEKKQEDSISSDRIASEMSVSEDNEEMKADEETTIPQDETELSIQMTTFKDTSFQIDKKQYYNSFYDITRIPISKFFDLSKQETKKQLVNEIQKEINDMAGCQFLLWNQYVELLRLNTIKFTKLLLDEYQQKINDQWGQSIFRYPVVIKEYYNYSEQRSAKQNIKQAKKYRKTTCFKNREPLNIEDLNLFPKAKFHPIIFHEVYTKNKDINLDISSYEPLKRDEAHVIVLVHGFQGSSFDLKLFSNNITIKHPDAIFLHSSCNEDYTDGDIEVMGIRLADEVGKFLSSQLYGRKLKRLSFVGHSLGGLILRSALLHLTMYQEFFFNFVTFSTPHLGFLFSQSKMVDAGLWFMKAWNKSESLKQMTLVDKKNLRETFIYQLAKQTDLSKFKTIILFSSPQDQYVPYHSARMQQTTKQHSDSKQPNIIKIFWIYKYYLIQFRQSEVYDEMLKEIFSRVTLDRIHRVDVSFEIPGKVLDNFIGRAAHIQFLENEALMKMILSDFKNIFI